MVTHAGQNAVADVAAARAPAVVIAQRRPFGEQAATAMALSRLGIADGHTSWPSADHWPDVLEAAHRRGGQSWSRWSSGHGARDAAAHLDALAGRTAPRGFDGVRMTAPRLAVVTIVRGRHAHLAGQVRGLRAQGRGPDVYVVVAIDDPGAHDVARRLSPAEWDLRRPGTSLRDGRMPLSAARNLGASTAIGAGAEHLVFLDVDCVPGPRPGRPVRRGAHRRTRWPPGGPVR